MNSSGSSLERSVEEDRRRTRLIQPSLAMNQSPVFNEIPDSDAEDGESVLNRTMNVPKRDNSLLANSESEEDKLLSASEEGSFCDQLREMSPTKIAQLLNQLEIEELNQKDCKEEENGQVKEKKQKNTQKSKVNNSKKVQKNTKGNKDHDLEIVVKDEPIPIKSDAAKGGNGKTKRGKKETADVDNKSKTAELIPQTVVSDKKPNKPKKTGKGKEPQGEKCVPEETPKDNETVDPVKKTSKKTDGTTVKPATKEKKASNKKEKEAKEESLEEKSNNLINPSTNETNDFKKPKIPKKVSKPKSQQNNEENIPPSIKKGNKIKVEKQEENKNIGEDENVLKNSTGRTLRNRNQTTDEVSKPKEKENLTAKDKEKSKKNTNIGKQKTSENSENKENNIKENIKAQSEPVKKVKAVAIKKKTEEEQNIVTKRTTRQKN